jgi:hypothetical protein
MIFEDFVFLFVWSVSKLVKEQGMLLESEKLHAFGHLLNRAPSYFAPVQISHISVFVKSNNFSKISDYNYMLYTISMGRKFSELRPPTGLLFIPEITHAYKYGQPREDDTDKGKAKEVGEKPVPVPFFP